jgi:hypothetical protein
MTEQKNSEFSALLYNIDAVELVANSDSIIWLSKTPAQPSKNWDACPAPDSNVW